MTTETPVRGALSDDELIGLIGLMKDADSVELKLTVDVAAHRATIQGLGLDPIDAQIRQVFFLDTPDQQLRNAGLILRTRRVQGRRGDSTVKIRPVVPAQLPSSIRQMPGFKVEVDAMPGSFVCSASLSETIDNRATRGAAAGEVPVKKLFSKEQREFYKAHAPATIALKDLRMMGPFFVLKEKWVPAGSLRSMTAEMWFYPDGSRVMELSTKCSAGEAFQVAAEARAFLSQRGIVVAGDQTTKTQHAVQFFAQAG
jgi:hypothetical protein